jgi:hypothetical protein
MASRIGGMVLGIVAVGVLVGALLFGLRPQAQEPDENEADQVSPSELAMYIDVYTAMQADHDLTLETILAQKGVSLDQFRIIERRIQKNDRLVRKVRGRAAGAGQARTDAIAPAARRRHRCPNPLHQRVSGSLERPRFRRSTLTCGCGQGGGWPATRIAIGCRRPREQ